MIRDATDVAFLVLTCVMVLAALLICASLIVSLQRERRARKRDRDLGL